MTTHPFYDGMHVPDENEFIKHGFMLIQPDYKTAKNNVLAAIQQIGLRPAELATLTGTSRMYINSIIHEINVPSIVGAMKIAYVLNVPKLSPYNCVKMLYSQK